jgi:hypothetical protein
MDRSRAYKLLSSELAPYRALSYDDLSSLIAPAAPRVISDDDSTRYAIQITVTWRNAIQGDILVDGWRALEDCGPLNRIDEHFVVSKARD